MANVELTAEEIQRYGRHLIMPEVGMEGQKKLKAASVLLIGAGGLGSPVGLYLAAAGIGRIGIVDFDVVDYSNLQRQILHSTKESILSSRSKRMNCAFHLKMRSTFSHNTTLWLTEPTIFRHATSSTTHVCSRENQMCTEAFFALKDKRQYSQRKRVRAIDAFIRSRRRPDWSRAVRREAFSVSCRASSEQFRQTKP